MQGRWGVYQPEYGAVIFGASGKIVIAFENDDDALMFKLMDGGAIWKDMADTKEGY
jgi:hypothetical protein